MYLQHLLSIEKTSYPEPLQPPKVELLNQLNNQLILIPPGNNISPRFLSQRLGIDFELIVFLLTNLSYNNLIDTEFIIRCSNEDEDLVDQFKFESHREVQTFIKSHNYLCPDCESELSFKDVIVVFKTHKKYFQKRLSNE